MRQDLQGKLFTAFPHLFIQNQPENSALPIDGMTCGDGWYHIIFDLCSQITAIMDHAATPYSRDDVQCTCVKQKYGELKFYLHYAEGVERSSQITEAYERAQERCLETCELCGSGEGTMNYDGEWQVLCLACEENMKKAWAAELRERGQEASLDSQQ